MYWLADKDFISLGIWGLSVIFYVLGGWLLATHAFTLERNERVVVGISLGLICYIWIANLLARIILPQISFFLASVAVLLFGAVFAWKSGRRVLDWHDLGSWKVMLVLAILIIFFALVSKGLAIFDEYKNLSLISTIAAGDVPPHLLHSEINFSYHYGFHLLGASMVRLGKFFPWSAFDLSKAVVWGLAVVLVYLIGKRVTKKELGAFTAALVFALAGGTRYLLLVFPASFLARLDPLIQLQGVALVLRMSFSQAMNSTIRLDGFSPPIPFAFYNGINNNFTFAHAGPGTLSLVILFTLWLLLNRESRKAAWIVVGIILACWALVWETSYALFCLGSAAVCLYYFFKQKLVSRRFLLINLVLPLMFSVPFALFQGGTLSEKLVPDVANHQTLSTSESQDSFSGDGEGSLIGFTFRWPPAVPSSNFDRLRFDSPLELLVGFFEIGPVLLFLPWILIFLFLKFKEREPVYGVFGVSTILGFFLPLILVYKVDRDITRLTHYSLVIWEIILACSIWSGAQNWSKRIYNILAALCVGAMLVGGLFLLGMDVSVIKDDVLGDHITSMDAQIFRKEWDRLPPGSSVFDPSGNRGVILTGRLTRMSLGSVFNPTEEWKRLAEEPSIKLLRESRYDYLYFGENWWYQLPLKSRQSLSASCARLVAEVWSDDSKHWRHLVDIRDCGSGQK